MTDKNLIIIDGSENCGKTTTINKLKEIYKENTNVSFLHFPSEELVKSVHFKNAIQNPTMLNCRTFIKALLNEIEIEINKTNSKFIIIDRLVLSSIVYQSHHESMDYEINYLYMKLFKKLKIKNIYHFLMLGFVAHDKEEKDEIKKELDINQKYQEKWFTIPNLIYSSNEEMFRNISTHKVNIKNIELVRDQIIFSIYSIIGFIG